MCMASALEESLDGVVNDGYLVSKELWVVGAMIIAGMVLFNVGCPGEELIVKLAFSKHERDDRGHVPQGSFKVIVVLRVVRSWLLRRRFEI